MKSICLNRFKWLRGLAVLLLMAVTGAGAMAQNPPDQSDEHRYERGLTALQALDKEAAQGVLTSLKEIAPDMGRFIIEFAYGDIHSRPGLDVKSRQVATVAALTALGNAAPQLRFHLGAALNAGVTPRELIEVIYVTTVFAGFPAGLNSVFEAKAVFAEHGKTVAPAAPLSGDRRSRGLAALEATSKGSGQAVLDGLKDIAPEMGAFIIDFSYGDIIARKVLPPKWKEIAMICAAVAKGTMQPQLKVHIRAGLNVGLSRGEIIELMYQMAVYAGFPAGINGIFAAQEVFAEQA
ncbi:MAG: carboxymuconolactone decarboxylase family protein [Desulfobacterales bacterium]|nr:carboxymuconolactone decarboxylase family protein [Desulfobacterales bacterium]